MNINQLDSQVSYYTDLVSKFSDKRDLLSKAGIWPVRGLLEPVEDTENFWIRKQGSKYEIGNNDYILDQENSSQRVLGEALKPFNKMINDCIDEYKTTHGISKITEPINVDTVIRFERGHNRSTHSHDGDYSVILYLNEDYVGGQLSFTTKENTAINPLVHPRYPENRDQIDFWLKPDDFSILIFPSNYKHIEHAIASWNRYQIIAEF